MVRFVMIVARRGEYDLIRRDRFEFLLFKFN